MKTLKAHVENGRVIVDEPTDLPDGTVLELVVPDEGDDLDEEERAALRAELRRSYAEYKAGVPMTSAEELLDELRNLK